MDQMMSKGQFKQSSRRILLQLLESKVSPACIHTCAANTTIGEQRTAAALAANINRLR